MFNNRKIKQIRKMPEGDAIIVTWLQLLCLAGQTNDNGTVYFSKDVPYTDEMLATEFDRPIATIRLALSVFEKFGMIEIFDNIFLVANWEKYQSTEKLDKIREQNRIRKQNQRERDKFKMLECHVTSHEDVTQSHATDIDKDIDKDIDNIPLKKELKNFNQEDKEYLLALYLSKEISKRLNKPPKDESTLQKWSIEFEKMVRLDKLDINEIKEVLMFSQRHEFWQSNILSASKFRKQYITLLAQMKRENKKGGDNFGKPGNGIKFNVPKTKVDTGEDLDRTIEELGLI